MMSRAKSSGNQPLGRLLAAVCAVIVALSVLLPVQSAGLASDYLSRALIQPGSSGTGYQLLHLPDEILSQCRPGLPDLRLYGGDGEIPYALLTDQDLMLPARARADLVNQGTDAGGNLVFEVQVPADKWVRQIQFLSQDRNFIRQVQVSGSRNGMDWVTLAADRTIFDLTAEHKTRRTEVSLGQTNFTHLRITVLGGGKGTFRLDGVELEYIPQTSGAVSTKERAHQWRLTSGKDGVDEYIVDLLQARLPVREVEFVAVTENFNRTVEVYVSDNNSDWKWAAQGEIYSYRLDKLNPSQRTVKFRTDLRYLKLRIHNQDNPPLPVSGLKIRGSNPLMVFPAQGDSSLYLYWNNSQVQAPLYDLAKFKGHLDYSTIPLAAPGPPEANPTFQFRDIRPWTERNEWLLKILLAVVVAVLLAVILQSIRTISSDNKKGP